MIDLGTKLIVAGTLLLAVGMSVLALTTHYKKMETKRANCALQGKVLVRAHHIGYVCVEGTEP